MIKLYTQEEYDATNSRECLPFQCEKCGNTFHRMKKEIKYVENNSERTNDIKYCSKSCQIGSITLSKIYKCAVCNKETMRRLSEYKGSKSGNVFCSRSCCAIYRNAHKPTGTRKSRLEVWLESQLNQRYPDDGILYNDKTIIKSELDIYFPKRKIAFELNGVFHYQPIYGDKKLLQTQANDAKKVIACTKNNIRLYVIDVTKQSIFSPKTSQEYLDYIIRVVESLN